ncbi:hypothetical protein DBB36_17310 [Flavobacterium sp. WLB]|uniref:hypothetical protein n=1 Tax=unclassified Flavobacterium TaxID=196869 RepID=UPI0006ABD50B|nr:MULTISPECIES: hypothetical protein [unclassified Flavobacterium]KOP38381.1 hypothetical protein AKO67_11160 [Flavobacterium sp. VMW]OWU92120.1 hypothetical protein APR43_02480 [Flavobacterium sp. NLM]PUU68732.1 hypothetical protein DBB36_17310 [Flavobacterium sp. WLB]
MRENILLLLQIITVDFFTAFGLYSILFLIVSIFIKKPILYKIDEEAVKFISLAGVIYFTVWIIGIFVFYAESNPEEKSAMLNRMFGEYWFGIWSQPILWFALTQLLRFKKVSKNALFRIVFSFLLIVSIERFMIFIITLHRDYLPSSWTMYRDLDIYPSNFFLALLMKIMVFLLFVGIYYLVKIQIEKITKTKRIEN